MSFCEIKHVFRAFIAWWKPRRTFGRIREQISENPRRSQGFSPAREYSQTLSRFSPGYTGTDNMFYFFYKVIIFFHKEKDDIRSALYCKFSQIGDSQTTLLYTVVKWIGNNVSDCTPVFVGVNVTQHLRYGTCFVWKTGNFHSQYKCSTRFPWQVYPWPSQIIHIPSLVKEISCTQGFSQQLRATIKLNPLYLTCVTVGKAPRSLHVGANLLRARSLENSRK